MEVGREGQFEEGQGRKVEREARWVDEVKESKKKELAEKKPQDKMTRWQQIRDNEAKKLAEEKRKTEFKEQRLLLEENKMRKEIIAENWLRMMDPSGMDDKAR